MLRTRLFPIIIAILLIADLSQAAQSKKKNIGVQFSPGGMPAPSTYGVTFSFFSPFRAVAAVGLLKLDDAVEFQRIVVSGGVNYRVLRSAISPLLGFHVMKTPVLPDSALVYSNLVSSVQLKKMSDTLIKSALIGLEYQDLSGFTISVQGSILLDPSSGTLISMSAGWFF